MKIKTNENIFLGQMIFNRNVFSLKKMLQYFLFCFFIIIFINTDIHKYKKWYLIMQLSIHNNFK